MKKPNSLKAVISANHGFTLVELLVCIAIIAILIAIAIPAFADQAEKAKTVVLQNNTQCLNELIMIYSIDYSKDKWHGNWDDDGDGTLNNYIELELERITAGTYENKINLINPHSKKLSILDWNQTAGSGDGYCPAVFLTANGAYSYSGSGSTNNIIGTIVAYFKDNGTTTEYIELYYVNKDGSKSAFTRRIS